MLNEAYLDIVFTFAAITTQILIPNQSALSADSLAPIGGCLPLRPGQGEGVLPVTDALSIIYNKNGAEDAPG
jgi:hypothetical protein